MANRYELSATAPVIGNACATTMQLQTTWPAEIVEHLDKLSMYGDHLRYYSTYAKMNTDAQLDEVLKICAQITEQAEVLREA